METLATEEAEAEQGILDGEQVTFEWVEEPDANGLETVLAYLLADKVSAAASAFLGFASDFFQIAGAVLGDVNQCDAGGAQTNEVSSENDWRV